MTRLELEHIIRASAELAGDDEIVVIGSQAILGAHPDAPAELCVSMKADVYPRNHPERADIIDGAIGELSAFHDTFGYYAQGVSPRTATLPEGWFDRAVIVENANTRGARGYCLEPHDLAIAKLIAGRDKDLRFVRDGAARGLLHIPTLRQRLAHTHIEDARHRQLLEARIAALPASLLASE